MNTRGGSRPSVFTNLIAIVSAAIVSGIASIGASAQSAQVEHPINSVREIRASLRACWISPEMSVPPQVTVRFRLAQGHASQASGAQGAASSDGPRREIERGEK